MIAKPCPGVYEGQGWFCSETIEFRRWSVAGSGCADSPSFTCDTLGFNEPYKV